MAAETVTEIRRGDVTGLLLHISNESEGAFKRKESPYEGISRRFNALYNRAGRIVEKFREVPGETGEGGVNYPHHLTPSVPFTSGETHVRIRLREITRQRINDTVKPSYTYIRCGVRVELADDSLAPKERALFDLEESRVIINHGKYSLSALVPETIEPSTFEELETLIDQIKQELPVPETH